MHIMARAAAKTLGDTRADAEATCSTLDIRYGAIQRRNHGRAREGEGAYLKNVQPQPHEVFAPRANLLHLCQQQHHYQLNLSLPLNGKTLPSCRFIVGSAIAAGHSPKRLREGN